MHSDDETCNMNIQAAIKDGVLSVTQDLNQTYNETAQQWNCQTVDSKGNVSIFVLCLNKFGFTCIGCDRKSLNVVPLVQEFLRNHK